MISGKVLKNYCIVFIFVANFWPVYPALSAEGYENSRFYMSTSGSDANPGTKEKPFASLEKVRDTIRQVISAGQEDTIFVYLRGGDYHRKKSFVLNEKDAGKKMYPIIYTAYQNEKVSISGGISLSPSDAHEISDKSVLKKLNQKAVDQILYIDLKEMGIHDYGLLRPRGFRRPYYPSAMELFCNHKPMTLGRWPNDSLQPLGKVVVPGSIPRNGDYSERGGSITVKTDRLEKWTEADEMWISGYFHYGFADDAVQVKSIDPEEKTITTRQPTMYGFTDGNDKLGWFAFNLLEEVDEPGEYFIDREAGIIYFYPLQKTLKTIEVSMLEEPMVVMENCSYIQIKNIDFECSRGMGIYMEKGKQNLIENCEFRNLGLMAICLGRGIEPFKVLKHNATGKIASRELGSWHEHIYDNPTFDRKAGTGHAIKNCHIYNTGSGGISLSGGNRLSLEKGLNSVENCAIHDVNRLDRTYRAGINIDGVGNIIRHCEIYNCPGSAIYLHGNDHLIEYNEIHHAVMEGDDMGSIYYGRDPSEIGHVVRYNLFHHLGSGDLRAGHRKIIAIYHDDGACGMEITGNIFYKAGSRAANIGGGNDNVYRNNIFIDGKLAVQLDNRLQGWAEYMWAERGIFEKRLEAVNYQEAPYAEKYPELKNYFNDSPGLPKRNYIEYNVFMAYDKVFNGNAEFSNFGENLMLCNDPGFEDPESLNFELDPESIIYQRMPEFKPIPVHLIGRSTKIR